MISRDLQLTNKITTLAEIIWYGIGWAELNVEENPHDGSFDTMSHQIACAICQWFDNKDGVGTSETEDFMFAKKFNSQQEVHRRLIEYLEYLQIHVSEWMKMSLCFEYDVDS